MYRFYLDPVRCLNTRYTFKYILCIGFTGDARVITRPIEIFKYILCIGFTSTTSAPGFYPIKFKYILCIGFTQFFTHVNHPFHNLNTSYVSVLPNCLSISILNVLEFKYILCIGFT